MADLKCDCLYSALLTTRERYCKERARDQYRLLINRANSLPSPAKNNTIQLLNLAKDTLGNLLSERTYFSSGIINKDHSCEDCSNTLETIKQLAEEQNTTSPNAESHSNSQQYDKDDKQSSSPISIEQITNHKFRNDKLKFSIIINPGRIPMIEDGERVTTLARDKVIEYLVQLRDTSPRRIGHLIRAKPSLLELLDGTE